MGDVTVNDRLISYKIRSEKQRQYKATVLCLKKEEIPEWAFNIWTAYWNRRNAIGLSSHPDLFVKQNGVVVNSSELNVFLSKGPRRLTTDSLRAGGATSLLLRGATLAQLCAKGRWNCEKSLLRYLRMEPNLEGLLKGCADDSESKRGRKQ